jgi:AcrR family transcriptional regulator
MAKQRALLSRDRVLRAAIRLADDSGLDSLTMRKLGQALGVEAMSLYNHVANKDDLLDGMLDLVLSEIDLSPDAADPEAALRKGVISAHEVLMRHPWACGLILSPSPFRVFPARMRYMESLLGRLTDAGFSADLTYHGYHALDSHILGFTLWALGHTLDVEDPAAFAASFVENLRADGYTHLIEHVEQHLDESRRDEKGEFEFKLDLILDGLKRMRG